MDTSSQTQQAYAGLRQAILSLDYAPGERLTERGLELRFGVSRTPARAALLRLEGEGLVRRAGRGWTVSPIDLDEVRALAEFRVAVEASVVRLACERASAADLDAVRASLDAARPLADEAEGVRAGEDFHSALARLSGNPFMAEGVRGAMTRLARTRWIEVRTPEAREQAWREHSAVLEAIAARDPDAAARLIEQHIAGTNERLVAVLDSERRRLRGSGLAIVGASVAGVRSAAVAGVQPESASGPVPPRRTSLHRGTPPRPWDQDASVTPRSASI